MSSRDYYNRKIKELEQEIASLQSARDNVSVEPLKEFKVSCTENNSGGSFWLIREQYDALEKTGFTTVRKARGFYKIVRARTEDEAISMVKNDFWDATKQNPDDEGCNCCGQPFWFSANDPSYENYWELEDYKGSGLRSGVE